MSNDQKGILLIILGMMLFGVQDLTIKSMVNTGSLLQIITLRGLIGSVILAVFLKSTGRSFSVWSHYPLLAITRGILFPFGFLCFYLALAKMPIAEASALFFVSPIFMTILSRIILKNKILNGGGEKKEIKIDNIEYEYHLDTIIPYYGRRMMSFMNITESHDNCAVLTYDIKENGGNKMSHTEKLELIKLKTKMEIIRTVCPIIMILIQLFIIIEIY